MSWEPRAKILPSSSMWALKGSYFHLSGYTGTTSMCEFRTMDGSSGRDPAHFIMSTGLAGDSTWTGRDNLSAWCLRNSMHSARSCSNFQVLFVGLSGGFLTVVNIWMNRANSQIISKQLNFLVALPGGGLFPGLMKELLVEGASATFQAKSKHFRIICIVEIKIKVSSTYHSMITWFYEICFEISTIIFGAFLSPSMHWMLIYSPLCGYQTSPETF